MFIVTIDSGTTNTRVRVCQGNAVIAEASGAVGVRDTAITGSQCALVEGVRSVLHQALSKANVNVESDEMQILASGMITSNMGLCEIPHLSAPVNRDDLASGAVQKVLPEIIDHPIWFIPGVKNNVSKVDLSCCELMDVMRGEETETIGAISLFDINGPALIILPGSHSKFVKLDNHNHIVSSATTIAGELLSVVTQNTILANSLDSQFTNNIDQEYLLKGAKLCQEVGLARSCFSVRILDLFSQTTLNQRANFLLGTILYSDILTIKNSQALAFEADSTIVICGKKILRQGLEILIKEDEFFIGKIIAVDEDSSKPLSVIGAKLIAERINELKNQPTKQLAGE
ncbi:2-dehydro-3-deoxygalactonokinase [Pragia fontium]|uniref:2-dehydro-3-deoxygalactonokinase n=1 Tax=Pragia fontium DSM 5563 = ATCC 49100 TaxID=1122977 RepID=A0AAJ4WAH8_9GAMM|nr:2-dehydro-3-deoxygalactonokinase [Pragia fontium]SFC79767.1 2-dehydro-3-deoxygalactonokinase [Pragia fontium DSM 5563 = ATCC 49100]